MTKPQPNQRFCLAPESHKSYAWWFYKTETDEEERMICIACGESRPVDTETENDDRD